MNNPAAAFSELKESVFRYIKTAFGSRSDSFEVDRHALLNRPGGVFQEPYIEPLIPYRTTKELSKLTGADLPDLPVFAQQAFKELCAALLFPPGHNLYTHQVDTLVESLAGKHCVVTTGTGSGKTEAFLLPLLASIVREAAEWEPTTGYSASGNTAARTPFWRGVRPPRWKQDKRCASWGEKREAALRAIVLYPMNALVEDQL